MLYLSPKSFPHLAVLSDEHRQRILRSCRAPLESLYVVLIVMCVLFAGSMARVLLEKAGFSAIVSSVVSTAVIWITGIVAYLVYINKYLYNRTLLNVKRGDDG